MPELTESRVIEIVNQVLDEREAQKVGAGRPAAGQPAALPAEVGKTFVPSIGKNVPNALVDAQGNKEGPMAYVSRIALLLANGDMEKARLLIDSVGALAPQGIGAGTYGFTADPASYPQAAANFAAQIFAKPGAGNVGR